jgi:hypothetical protein
MDNIGYLHEIEAAYIEKDFIFAEIKNLDNAKVIYELVVHKKLPIVNDNTDPIVFTYIGDHYWNKQNEICDECIALNLNTCTCNIKTMLMNYKKAADMNEHSGMFGLACFYKTDNNTTEMKKFLKQASSYGNEHAIHDLKKYYKTMPDMTQSEIETDFNDLMKMTQNDLSKENINIIREIICIILKDNSKLRNNFFDKISSKNIVKRRQKKLITIEI